MLEHVGVERVEDAGLDVGRDGVPHLAERGRLVGENARPALRAGAGAVERAPDAVAAGGFRIADKVLAGHDGRPLGDFEPVVNPGHDRKSHQLHTRQDIVGRPVVARVVVVHGAARLRLHRGALARERAVAIAVNAASRARALVFGRAALRKASADDGFSQFGRDVMGFGGGALRGFASQTRHHASPAGAVHSLHGIPSFLPIIGGLFL